MLDLPLGRVSPDVGGIVAILKLLCVLGIVFANEALSLTECLVWEILLCHWDP